MRYVEILTPFRLKSTIFCQKVFRLKDYHAPWVIICCAQGEKSQNSIIAKEKQNEDKKRKMFSLPSNSFTTVRVISTKNTVTLDC